MGEENEHADSAERDINSGIYMSLDPYAIWPTGFNALDPANAYTC